LKVCSESTSFHFKSCTQQVDVIDVGKRLIYTVAYFIEERTTIIFVRKT